MKKLFLCILLLLLFVSCSNSPINSKGVSVYYYKDSNRDSLVSVTIEIPEGNAKTTAENALNLLYTPDDDYISVFTSGLRHSSVELASSVCTVSFPSSYLSLSATNQIAIDSAVVKTLCSLEEIKAVIISCDDIAKKYTANDIVLSAPKIYQSTQAVNLYFANKDYTSLTKISKNITIQSGNSIEQTVISSLLQKPASKDLQSPIPEGTKLNGVSVVNGICYIDLSSEFVENAVHTKEREAIAIYSIVNTVTELPLINSVNFLIDGKTAHGFLHYDISTALTNKSDLFSS